MTDLGLFMSSFDPFESAQPLLLLLAVFYKSYLLEKEEAGGEESADYSSISWPEMFKPAR